MHSQTLGLLRKTVFPPLFLAGLFIGSAFGATYYVDNSGGGKCSDRPANGSEANPWCAVSYGIGRLSGGDTLYVKAGTYHEAGLYIPASLSGTAAQPTTVAAYPGDAVTISGDGINTGRVKITGCSNLIFRGFVITNLNQGVYVEASTSVTVENCTIHDIGQEGIHVNGNSEYITIQNCAVFDTGEWRYNGEGIYVGTGSAGPLDNTAHVVVRSNLVYHTGQDSEAVELKPGTHDCTVEYNRIHDIHTGSSFGAIEVNEAILGVQHWVANPNHQVRGNVLHNTETAIRLGTGSLAYNNLIFGVTNGNYGILLDNNTPDSYLRRIYHNTIDVPASSAVFIQTGQSLNSDIRNNIGPAMANNLSADASYFVNPSAGDYHLIKGTAPVDAGVDLSASVASDLDGIPRPAGAAPDLGAFEFVEQQPSLPVNPRVVR